MVGDGGDSISAGVWLKRARGGVEKVDGKAVQLGARRIEAEWRETAGTELCGGSSSSLLRASARKEKGATKTKTSLGKR